MGGEKESIGDVPKATTPPAQVQMTAPNGGFLGNEQESIGDKPTEKDTPSIPTSDARVKGEKDNQKIAPEKEEQATGNAAQNGVTASSGKESKPNTLKEATRIAGRMLVEGMIKDTQLSQKISELSEYKAPQLADFESAIFASKKGLNASSDGLEQPVIISEASNARSGSGELFEKLSGMFSLSERVDLADSDDSVQIRKSYGRL